MEKKYCCISHPQPPKGGSCSELLHGWYAAEVPFRACPDYSGGFRGKSNKEYCFINFTT